MPLWLEIIKTFSIPIIVLVMFLILKKEINSITFPGGAKLDFYTMKQQVVTSPSQERILKYLEAKWENTGNIYWLGHDLAWTMQVNLRGAKQSTLIRMMEQSLHHLRSIDLKDKRIEEQLVDLLENLKKINEQDLLWDKRNQISKKLDIIIDDIGKYMETNQIGFKPYYDKEIGKKV
jgi:hypothetical protein